MAPREKCETMYTDAITCWFYTIRRTWQHKITGSFTIR